MAEFFSTAAFTDEFNYNCNRQNSVLFFWKIFNQYDHDRTDCYNSVGEFLKILDDLNRIFEIN